jgi:hypothetical protein
MQLVNSTFTINIEKEHEELIIEWIQSVRIYSKAMNMFGEDLLLLKEFTDISLNHYRFSGRIVQLYPNITFTAFNEWKIK